MRQLTAGFKSITEFDSPHTVIVLAFVAQLSLKLLILPTFA